MVNYLDYKTCPKCYAVVEKSLFSKHIEVCDPESGSRHPVDIAKAKKIKEEAENAEKIKNNTKYNNKDISEMRAIAKEHGIITGTKGVKRLIEEVLIKESENG